MFKVIIYKRLYEKWYENENSYILKSLQGITFNTTKVDFPFLNSIQIYQQIIKQHNRNKPVLLALQ